MFKPSKRIAATLGVVAIAGTSGLLGLAPAASAAGPVKVPMKCDVPWPPGTVVDADVDFTLEMPAPVAPGGEAAVKFTMGQVPVVSPVGATVKTDVTFDINTSGGTSTPMKFVAPQGD